MLLLNYTEEQRIFQELNEFLIFDNKSTEAIKMNHLKTLICGGLVGADKLERFLLLKAEQLMLKIIRKEPLKDTILHHQGNNGYNALMAFCDELKALSVLEMHTPLMVLPK